MAEAVKILVLSDSHGRKSILSDIIAEHADVNEIVFLGDGERDFEAALAECNIAPYGNNTSVNVTQVKGNCDLFSREAVTLVREFGGVRFLITHGYDQHVKRGLDELAAHAGAMNCRVALYGHTHIKKRTEKGGVVMINPGSAADGNYCVVEVTAEKAVQTSGDN
ncbi:MAG: YfcE family phosphodiesterase [Parasporobacterium sp.]|nr:YfcE family phosphodiesterase [Parasporobacterium sp.]